MDHHFKQLTSHSEWFKAIKDDYISRHQLKWFLYNDWLELDREATKIGMPIFPAYWNCPICKTCWHDCHHPLVSYWGLTASYPTWEDRPWKKHD